MSETSKTFASGDKVFAKMKGYPHWPARVIAATAESSKRYHIHFYGTNQTAAVRAENICLYIENKAKFSNPRKHKYFSEALDEIERDLNPVIEASVTSEVVREEENTISETTDNSTAIATSDHPTADKPKSKKKKVKVDSVPEKIVNSSTDITSGDQPTDDKTKPKSKKKKIKDDIGSETIDNTSANITSDQPTADKTKPKSKKKKLKTDIVSETIGNTSANITSEQPTADEPKPKSKKKKIKTDASPNESKNSENKEKIDSAIKERKISTGSAKKKTSHGTSGVTGGFHTPKIVLKRISTKAKKKDKKNSSQVPKKVSQETKWDIEEEPAEPDFLIAVMNNEQYKIPLSLNKPDFVGDMESAELWKELVLQYAQSLQKRIESGEIMHDIYGLMDRWTTLKALEFSKKNMSEEQVTKFNFLQTEATLLDIDIEIKKALGLEKAEPQRCIELLEKFKELAITPLMLKKHPDLVHTIRRMRNYIGNTSCWQMDEEQLEMFKECAGQIRLKSEEVYNKFKDLFESDLDHFWDYFMEEVERFREKTSNMNLHELLSLVEDP